MGAAITVHLELRSDGLASNLGALLGTIQPVRDVHGVVAAATDRLDAKSGDLVITMTIVPRAHNLALVETYQVFLETSLPDILRAKLVASGLEVEGEDEGFPRSTRPEQLEVCRPGSMIVGGVLELSATKKVVPSLYVEMDYNYRTPQTDLTSQHELLDAYGGGVIEYGAHFRDPDEGARIARIRAEESRAGQLVFEGRTAHPGLAPGKRLKIVDDVRFPQPDLLITEVHHDLVQPATMHDDGATPRYDCRFVGIPASRPWRPARATPRPRIHGLLHAIVG